MCGSDRKLVQGLKGDATYLITKVRHTRDPKPVYLPVLMLMTPPKTTHQT